MKNISRIILFLMPCFLLSTTVYAHPGHNHIELTLSELFVHMLLWGGLLSILTIGVWLLIRGKDARFNNHK